MKASRLRIAAVLAAAVTVALLAPAVPASAAAPVASFEVSAGEHVVGAPVHFASTSTDLDTLDILTASWDFGDGTPVVVGTAVDHTFAAASSYAVTLTVSDGTDTGSAVQVVAVVDPPPPPVAAPAPAPVPPPANVAPVADFTASPALPNAGQRITLTSTSSDADGTIALQRWDLNGDGRFQESSGTTATWVFSRAGAHTIGLRVRDNAGAETTVTHAITVNQSPRAAFTTAPAHVIAGDTVAFASTSSDVDGTVNRLEWSLDGDGVFDDGGTLTVQRPYGTPGAVTVRLRVTDDSGATAVATALVTVLSDRAPIAAFGFSPAAPLAGSPVAFSSAATDPDGTIAGVAWDLDGDGFFDDASGPSAAWTYPAAGDYTVALRATDDRGASSIAFQTISIRGAVSPPDAPAAPPPGISAPNPPPSNSTPSPGTSSGAPPAAGAAPGLAALGRPMIAPFPIVRIRGTILRGSVRIELLSVRAPRGAGVRIRCRGRGCRRPLLTVAVKSAARPVRISALEAQYRPGAVLEVYVTMRGHIGKYVRFAIRRGAAPARSDLCLGPTGTKPISCPAR